MDYLLVLQFSNGFVEDIDRVIEIEDRVIEVLADTADVDGHDFGAGEANIFIFTDMPGKTFERLRSTLKEAALNDLKAAYRGVEEETYTVLHPPGLTKFAVV